MIESRSEECRTDFVRAGDSSWELIGDETVVYVYGDDCRIRVAGQELRIMANMLRALQEDGRLSAALGPGE